MTWHHTDQGERNGRHDHQGGEVALELRHHQEINQNQTDAIGCTHVTECFVRDLRFAIPFDGVLTVGIARLLRPVLAQCTLTWQCGILEMRTNAKQTIQRRVL